MSGVILRCPNCGTAQSAEGQCSACHEVSVRYFCTNHTPGIWLESTSCPKCGANFGDPEPARTEPIPEPPPSTEPPAFPRPSRPRVTRPTKSEGIGPWYTDAPSDVESGRRRTMGPDSFRMLLATMAAAARARSERAHRLDHEEMVPARPQGGSCLGRLLMLALLLMALLLMAPVLLGILLGFT